LTCDNSTEGVAKVLVFALPDDETPETFAINLQIFLDKTFPDTTVDVEFVSMDSANVVTYQIIFQGNEAAIPEQDELEDAVSVGGYAGTLIGNSVTGDEYETTLAAVDLGPQPVVLYVAVVALAYLQ
jgi:hypothetical protein